MGNSGKVSHLINGNYAAHYPDDLTDRQLQSVLGSGKRVSHPSTLCRRTAELTDARTREESSRAQLGASVQRRFRPLRSAVRRAHPAVNRPWASAPASEWATEEVTDDCPNHHTQDDEPVHPGDILGVAPVVQSQNATPAPRNPPSIPPPLSGICRHFTPPTSAPARGEGRPDQNRPADPSGAEAGP